MPNASAICVLSSLLSIAVHVSPLTERVPCSSLYALILSLAP
jgi:hypothetical protein